MDARAGRRVVVAVLAGVASFAALTSSAVAQQAGVEVVDESTATHCPATQVNDHVVSGGCHMIAFAEDVELSGHLFGIEAHGVTCDLTMALTLDEVGNGYLSNFGADHVGEETDAGCETIRACISEGTHAETHPGTSGNEAGEHVWPATLSEPAANVEKLTATVCIHTGQSLEECEGELHFNAFEVNEDLTEAQLVDASLPEGAVGTQTRCELSGHFDVIEEIGDSLHFDHPS